MDDKFIYIPNDDIFCISQLVVETLEFQLNEPTNQNSIKVPKFVKPNVIIKLWGQV